MPRSDAFRISIFNHKGGVGKTTLTVNIALTLAAQGKRVLLVDSDPQGNLTSYLIEENVVDDLMDQSDTESGGTLWSAVKPIVEAEGQVKTIDAIPLSQENAFLLPGDIRLSEFEAELNDFWGQCYQRKAKGFRGTAAISTLVNEVTKAHQIDFVFYDSGPNIGPLNRAILLDCDGFVVPVACDLFSRRALKTLGRTLVQWIGEWQNIADLAPLDMYLLPGRPRFLGFIPQRFRVYRGRLSKQHSTDLSRIDKQIQSDVIAVLRKVDRSLALGTFNQFKLGQVKDLGTLVSADQNVGVGIAKGSAGSSAQREQAGKMFEAIVNKLLKRVTALQSAQDG